MHRARKSPTARKAQPEHEPDRSSIPIATAPRMVREYPESPTGTPAMPARFRVSRGDSRMMHDAPGRFKLRMPSQTRVESPTGHVNANPVELIAFRADSASWARTGTFGTAIDHREGHAGK